MLNRILQRHNTIWQVTCSTRTHNTILARCKVMFTPANRYWTTVNTSQRQILRKYFRNTRNSFGGATRKLCTPPKTLVDFQLQNDFMKAFDINDIVSTKNFSNKRIDWGDFLEYMPLFQQISLENELCYC